LLACLTAYVIPNPINAAAPNTPAAINKSVIEIDGVGVGDGGGLGGGDGEGLGDGLGDGDGLGLGDRLGLGGADT
jgi:hypothetical protein